MAKGNDIPYEIICIYRTKREGAPKNARVHVDTACIWQKSIKITNNFTNFKTIISLVLAFLVMSLTSMLYDLGTNILLQMMFH